VNEDIPAEAIPDSSARGAGGTLYEALLKADRSDQLSQLAAGIGKELNELLAVIVGAIEVAAPSDQESMARAKAACAAAHDLSRRLLVLGRGGEARRSIVEPRSLLLEAARTAGAGSPVEIAIDVAEDAHEVEADRAQLLQAVQSLTLNALQAMPPTPHRSQVQLRAANTSLPEGRIAGLAAGEYVEFEVRDNGSGIDPAHLERIWDPFFTTRKHGAGLGLPAALAIIRRHGGQIGVDSTPGIGTVFTFFLPRAFHAGQQAGRRASSERFRTGRVLVMDDDAEIAALTGAMLQKLDYKFDLSANGEEAVAAYRRYSEIGRPYDTVILDLDIVGGMGGWEAFEEIRAIDPDARAIAVHSGDESETERCLGAGFCGCLAKPFRAAELGQMIATVLG
jgi:two-component system cell cycle sensor histidine kinase/response regulator CckA